MTAPLDVGGMWRDRTGLFVFRGDHVSINVRHPGEPMTVKGVSLLADKLTDDACLVPALRVLNDAIAGWPVAPVTCEQVRELAA